MVFLKIEARKKEIFRNFTVNNPKSTMESDKNQHYERSLVLISNYLLSQIVVKLLILLCIGQVFIFSYVEQRPVKGNFLYYDSK